MTVPAGDFQKRNLKGRDMAKTGKRRPMERTRKIQKIRPGAPLLETRARSILSAMVDEVTGETAGVQLPEVPPLVIAEAGEEAAATIDDLPASDLAAIARQGASLELDGARYDAEELLSVAKNVKDDAHLKVSNSGTFTAEELGKIARSTPGQVIFA
jgi:hypothetical protein